jgi:hypothetical protein
MLWLLADGSPNRALSQMHQFARLLVHLGKHEALEESVGSFNLDGACHTCRQLVAVAEKLFTKDF